MQRAAVATYPPIFQKDRAVLSSPDPFLPFPLADIITATESFPDAGTVWIVSMLIICLPVSLLVGVLTDPPLFAPTRLPAAAPPPMQTELQAGCTSVDNPNFTGWIRDAEIRRIVPCEQKASPSPSTSAPAPVAAMRRPDRTGGLGPGAPNPYF